MCLRKILGVSRLDKIRNSIIRQSLDMNHAILNRVTQKRLRFFGHIQIMPNTMYPKILLEASILPQRPKGRPAKRWTDCIKTDSSTINLTSLVEAGRLATQRTTWQSIMTQMARQSDPPMPTP
ncbi:uncharacterized protein [Amphiura filiformis]|uniref:uncharacterized protein n=1 Tax=Amphiura filiformis TaxID=82378 RepID=UPI003B21E43B